MKIEDAQFMHITIDALGAKNCDDEKTVEFFLHHAAKEMGMIPVGPSMVYGFPKRDEHTDSGFTGVQVIMESHISIHTFPEAGNLVCIDLFSCKAFDSQALVKLVDNFWKPKRMIINSVDRQQIIDMWLGRGQFAMKVIDVFIPNPART